MSERPSTCTSPASSATSVVSVNTLSFDATVEELNPQLSNSGLCGVADDRQTIEKSGSTATVAAPITALSDATRAKTLVVYPDSLQSSSDLRSGQTTTPELSTVRLLFTHVGYVRLDSPSDVADQLYRAALALFLATTDAVSSCPPPTFYYLHLFHVDHRLDQFTEHC